MNRKFQLVAGFSSCVILVAAAVPARAQVHNVAGSCQPAFGSSICTWAKMAGSRVVSMGANVPLAAIENSPADGQMVWPPAPAAVIAMPTQARRATGVDHLTVYWEHHGHPPTPYLTPHFDFHFYTISDADRQAIDCTNKTKPLAAAAGYSLTDIDIPGIGKLEGLCVPGMGMHAISSSELTSTTPFSGTMVLGYYDSKPIFFEPMVAKAKLMEKKSFSLPMTVPKGLGKGVQYPRKFEAVYDAKMPGYRLVFTEFRGN
ncbi:MAG TPA: DUF5602 domain-containing protein [Gemmatimonadaceae bacterium]|jgi:hypothetical protein|nr:DUF5602 domain-containing protein [Gemmatimonadaceae bacterium]